MPSYIAAGQECNPGRHVDKSGKRRFTGNKNLKSSGWLGTNKSPATARMLYIQTWVLHGTGKHLYSIASEDLHH